MEYNANLIRRADEIKFSISDMPKRREPAKVLMCSPQYFKIVDEKNVHMQHHIGSTDIEEAMEEWNHLNNLYSKIQQEGILERVYLIPGVEGLEDMVFCANQSFPWIDDTGNNVVVMSNMKHTSRQREVVHFENFYKENQYTIFHLPPHLSFEGMGDAIAHPHRRLLYGGYGHRTSLETYKVLSEILNTSIITLELKDPRFYHLDTCFVPLDENTVMLCDAAFTAEGLNCISKLFSTILYVDAAEAVAHFSLNAHAFEINNKRVAILQQGSNTTLKHLKNNGFDIHEIQTREFMKSGGSVFCMKMMIY